MSRKSIALVLFTLFIVTCYFSLSLATAQTTGWSNAELSSNPGFSTTIDGIKETDWGSKANITYYTNDTWGISFKLYVQHYQDYLYFLIEITLQYSTPQNETFSIFLSRSNSTATADFMDKKQITLINAHAFGNSSSNAADLHRNNVSQYVVDSQSEGFTGAAGIKDNQNITRFFEFKILRVPANASSTEDAKLEIYKNYAIIVGHNNTNSPGEKKTPVLFLQIGPKGSASQQDIGEFQFNTELYILIVMIVVSSFFGIYGIALISSKTKIGTMSEKEVTGENA